MADMHDDRKVPEMPAVDEGRPKGGMPQQPFGTGDGPKGGHGIAFGHNTGGMVPGGRPATGLSGAPLAAMTRLAALPLGMMKFGMTTGFRLLEAIVPAARSNPVPQ
ncbi:hypothetical protein ACFQS7_30600 [Dankookia sp. GCM10030260]|uniref:hypothetical protein n=1 Tax=Dankookia sp. GCM10030260 TaxID=3273390 RepID=UPI0036134528